MIVLRNIIVLVAFCWISLAQNSGTMSSYSTKYENHNQIDYGPLKVSAVQGWSVIRVADHDEDFGAPGAWYGLFSETDHKLLSSVRADADGHFSFQDVPPGLYRLVAKAQNLCAANVPLVVVKRKSSHNTYLLIHFSPSGVDTCSYGELARRSAP
jgi:hypothetical protein